MSLNFRGSLLEGGDGTRSSEPTPRHVFPADGVYPVAVRATDADGTRQASVLARSGELLT